MCYLRQTSWEEGPRTVFHDLITPHRSYAFSKGPLPSTPKSGRWETVSTSVDGSRAKTGFSGRSGGFSPLMTDFSEGLGGSLRALQDQKIVGAKRDKFSNKREGLHQNRGKFDHVLVPAEKRTTQVPTQPRPKREKSYKFKPKTLLVLSQEFHDQKASLQNDLVGPFQNPAKLNGIQYCGPAHVWQSIDRPTVRSMSTFEEYLERTVNSMRGDSQIAFHPSMTVLKKNKFVARRTITQNRKLPAMPVRSVSIGLDHLDFQAASSQLSMRAERSATSLGFAPSREIGDMHRLQAPWMVDPSLFVRVYADAIQTIHSSNISSPTLVLRGGGARSPESSEMVGARGEGELW